MDLTTPEPNWRVHALGNWGTEFVYEVCADSEKAALEEGYGVHGRRMRANEVQEALGVKALAFPLG